MGAILFIAITVAIILTGSIIMIFIRRLRKAGLLILGSLVLLIILTVVIVFTPKHYERKYLVSSPAWSNLSLRKLADSTGFYIGAIPGVNGIADPLFARNFNSVTPENALKMGPLLKDQKIGEYDFTYADEIVNKALEKNLRVRGHTLVWGKQSDMFKNPDIRAWLETFPEADRSMILKNLVEKHITTVLNHFRGRIHEWDCVNETMSMIRQGRLENNVYLKYLGEDYIADAFRIAHSVDPDVKLFLNENFISYTDKTAESFIELLKKLRSGNVPVHGVGIQGHTSSKMDTSIVDLQNFIKKITDLGLDVEITELDTRLRMFNAAADPYEAQGKYYARLVSACMTNPSCKGVTFWGFSDARCWMDDMGMFFPKPNEPYLFDAGMNPKPAFYEVYRILKSKSGKGI